MEIRSFIKKRVYYYLKKELLKSLKKSRAESQELNANTISTINTSILNLKEEVDLFLKLIYVVETEYGNSIEAAGISTIFPFFNLSMIDILILSKQYLSAKDIIEKNFICRTAAHHMYEFLEDGSKALGKQINFLSEKFYDSEFDLKLKALRKLFNDLKKELHSELKKLRHNVSGHKDRDIRKQLLISSTINIVDFQNNFFLFMQFFIELSEFKKLVFDEIKKRPLADRISKASFELLNSSLDNSNSILKTTSK